ncbi:MAG: hypothetical protein PHS41_10785 [Victivallaceae bacterium]|nr:hypothetical protein [Victivallaceae bacterium]
MYFPAIASHDGSFTSALRANALSSLLNSLPPQGGTMPHAVGDGGDLRLTIQNRSDKTLDAGAPVVILDKIFPEEMAGGDWRNFIFNVTGATDPTQPFLVLTTALKPDEPGEAMAAGMVFVSLLIASPQHEYVTLGEDGCLKSAKTGMARILWKSRESGMANTLLLLGFTPPPAPSEYIGPFGVKYDPVSGMLSIKDTSFDASQFAGRITVGTEVFLIPITNLAPRQGQLYVFLEYIVREDGNSGYSYGFAIANKTPSPGLRYWCRRIAHIAIANGNVSVTQVHTGGDLEVFGRWCD